MISYRSAKKIINKTKKTPKKRTPEKKRTKELSLVSRFDRLADDYAELYLRIDALSRRIHDSADGERDTRVRLSTLEQRVDQIIEDIRPLRGPLPAALATRILDLEKRHEALDRRHYAMQSEVDELWDGPPPHRIVVAEELDSSETSPTKKVDSYGAVFLVLACITLVGILGLMIFYTN